MLASLVPSVKAAWKGGAQMVGGVIGTAIWSAYLIQSLRVKSTFVRRYRVSAPLPQIADQTSAGEPMIPTTVTDLN
jgi:prolipoprotein diacylglyceryltransferase